MSLYLRFPALSDRHIAFVAEDDLWVAPAEGGDARRLTSGFGRVEHPAFSPDGSLIAFQSNAEGPVEVFVCPVTGGVPQRVTYEADASTVIGFRSDDTIVYGSGRGGALRSDRHLYTIRIDGTGCTRIPVGRAMHISFDETTDGDRVVLGLNATDSARWKRYRGGTAGDVWIGSLREQQFSRLIEVDGNPVLPTFCGDRVYVIDDSDGYGNLWSCTSDGNDLTQHTRHRDFYARHLKRHGATLVYQHGGRIRRYDTRSGQDSLVELNAAPSGTQLQRKFVDPHTQLQHLALSPDGKHLAAVVRGKCVTAAAWGGAVRRVGEASGVRYREAVWITGGEEIAVMSDAGGEEGIELHDVATGECRRRFVLPGSKRLKALYACPARRAVAATDVSGKLFYADVDNPDAASVLADPRTGPIHDVAFSPDGAWLAYVEPISWLVEGGRAHLLEIATGRSIRLNDDDVPTHSPAFDPKGRFLFVVSERTFNPAIDSSSFATACVQSSRIYAYVLASDQISPFDDRWREVLESEEKDKSDESDKDHGRGKSASGSETGGDADAEVEPIRVDLEGLESRMAVCPHVHPGDYGDLHVDDDKLVFRSWPILGLLDHERDEDDLDHDLKPSLECYELRTGKLSTLIDAVKAIDVRAGRTLALAEEELYLLETGEEPPKEPPHPGHSRQSGTIDLDRLRVDVVPGDEWRQMFEEAWRLQRTHFWAENMAEVDWDDIRERYLPLVSRVTTRAELSDVIWEMQGELGTSHAYEWGGDYPARKAYPVGLLGVETTWDGTGYRIDRFLEGDPWDPDVSSPLGAPGVRAEVGDRIVGVAGHAVSERDDPRRLLVHAAATDVEIVLEPAGGGERRRVDVRTLASEKRLRYRDWVRRTRRAVAEASDGRLGYVHVPNMSGLGLSEFLRSFRTESRRDGLIVDARSNGGGFVSQLIIERLRRRVIGWERPRYGRPETYPADTVRGPIVALCDQFAGSDGDIFSHAFKAYEIGTLVGKRTWGGVIGINVDFLLADGTTVTQPEFSCYFDGPGWNIENYGVDPDVEVDMDPASSAAGKDPQLERAIAIAMEQLETRSVGEPEWPPVPSRRF